MIQTNSPKCQNILFGIPITVKDTFEVSGVPVTMGAASRVLEENKQDGFIIQLLKNSGAIILAKSNIPQGLFAMLSENFIFGATKNPWNISRSPGGSTGGEGALTAARCNIVGLGSDIAGSIRIPASFCGVVGFKPGSQRVPDKGHCKMEIGTQSTLPGVQPSIGPMARNVEDCAIFMQALLDSDKYAEISKQDQDHYFQATPFDMDLYQTTKKLRIGIFKQFQICTSTLVNQRAVDLAAECLLKNGHEIVEFEIPQIDQIALDFGQIFYADGGVGGSKLLQGEKLITAYKRLNKIWLNPIYRKYYQLLAKISGNKFFQDFMKRLEPLTAAEDRNLHFRLKQHREKFVKHMIDEGIDAILCPSQLPAVIPQLAGFLNGQSIYTYVFNAMNLPAGSLPVTLVQDDEQHFNNTNPKKDLTYPIMQLNMKNSKGLPVSVQIATLPYQEELCLNIMKQIENQVNFNSKYQPQEIN